VEALEAAGVRTMLPPAEAVQLCLDKWSFVEAMNDAGQATPATELGAAGDIPGPWVIKPRFGRGSRDVYVARSATELKAALKWTPDPIVQALVTGREFTVDVLVDGSGSVAGPVRAGGWKRRPASRPRDAPSPTRTWRAPRRSPSRRSAWPGLPTCRAS
jgi:carbamoyl-phosphate synthase large subunit